MTIYIPVFQYEKEFSNEYGIDTVLTLEENGINNGFTTFGEAEKHILENGYRKSKYFENGFSEYDYEKDTAHPFEYATIFKIDLKIPKFNIFGEGLPMINPQDLTSICLKCGIDLGKCICK